MIDYNKEIDLFFELKGTPSSSKESYLRRILAFIKFVGNDSSFENLSYLEVQQFILFLKNEKKLKAGTINTYISSVRFFYIHVLDKEWNFNKVPRMRIVPSFPILPPKQDVFKLINETSNLKHKAILSIIYGSGLRVSEAVKLRISDICSKSMTIRVCEAKHNTNRNSILSEETLNILRIYFKSNFSRGYKMDDYLFPGREEGDHLNIKSVKNVIIKLRNKLNLSSSLSSKSLRHCFATHCLENGVEAVIIQQLLGHKHLNTTNTYLRMTSKALMGVKSPLDCPQGI